MPKYCPNCGTEISERVKYCPSCGVKLEIFSLNKDKKSTIGGTSGSEDGTPNRDNSSLPLSECFFCGVKTSKIFYCPLCGHDFCYLHKLHRDHFCKENVPFEQQKFSNSNQTVRHSKGTIGRPIVVMIFVILAIIVGVVFALGTHLFPTGLDPTNPPITVGCVTESKTEATTIPQTSLPTEIPTQIQQYTYTIQVTRTPYPYVTLTSLAYPRPPTGTIVSGYYMYGGEGELTIDNTAGSSDVVSSLTYEDSKKTLIAVFIRKGGSFTLKNIIDGTYNLYVLSGENWDPNNKQFVDDSYYIKFQDSFSYITTRTQSRIWEVTIYPVVNGNAKTKPISKDEFPML